jgi:D-cysteine desulfhydrase
MFDFLKKREAILHAATPIHRLERFSQEIGCNIYMKRDDLTGMGLSGNKIRKLEYHLFKARAEGANCMITCGGIQSNHARVTAVLCRRFGLHPVLILGGTDPGPDYQGNLLLDKLLDAEIHWVDEHDLFHNSDKMIAETAAELHKNGYQPYVMPMGGTDSVGLNGYIAAGLEIREQEKQMHTAFDAIFCAVGTGGTLGGLIIFKELIDWKVRLYGVNVMLNAEYFRERIDVLVREFIDGHKLSLPHHRDMIQMVDGFVGPGYAKTTPEGVGLIKRIARLEGIFLDPVYTGKAFQGMMKMIEDGRFTQRSNILFLHTGGMFGLFAQAGDLFPGE